MYQFPEDGAIAPKYVGGFMKIVRVYMLCEFVGLIIENKNYIKGHGGGTNYILRIKEQETHLNLHEHDNDDDERARNKLIKNDFKITKLIKIVRHALCPSSILQGGSNMTGTDLCVRLYKSVPVIFEPPCIFGIL